LAPETEPDNPSLGSGGKSTVNKKDFPCKRCGGEKKVIFERKPLLLLISAVCVPAVLLALSQTGDPLLKAGLLYLGLPLALGPAIATIHIRCLRCEPEWKERMWGSGQ